MNGTIPAPSLDKSTPIDLGDPIEVLKNWQNQAWNRFDNSNVYSEIHQYYEGYATAIGDALNLLKAQNKEAVVEELAKKSHKLRKLALLAAVAGGAYVGYQRYQNGILFPWQRNEN